MNALARPGGDIVALDEAARRYRTTSGYAPKTLREYARWFRRFTDFCAPADVWKADHRDVRRWFVFLAQTVKPQSVEVACAALTATFETLGKGNAHGEPGLGTRSSPARHAEVQRVLRGIRAEHGAEPVRKRPLLIASLDTYIAASPETVRAIRDAAILCVGVYGCRRRSEIVGLDFGPGGDGSGYATITNEGLLIKLRRSKTSRAGDEELPYAIPYRRSAPRFCPVMAVERWIDAAGIAQGEALFRGVDRHGNVRPNRLCGGAVGRVVKRAALELGMDPACMGGHSLRAGGITSLAKDGLSLPDIQVQSGHKSLGALATYVRLERSFEDSPLLRLGAYR